MLQPASTQAPADVAPRTAAVVDALRGLEGPLLPILHGLQEEFGYVPQESLPIVARALNISNAEAHGVASFYHDYRKAPAGRHVLKICRAEACQSMGSETIAARMEQLLGIRFGETSRDGAVTLEAVYCLGLCACGPSAMLDGRPIGRLDEEAIGEIVTAVRQ
ncbi:MAG: formate dehydrogenase subunit gamma [Rhizobiaceae bacterium]|nr:formate dehydrogenase subunit gamma [Rhizobiaceae bacterium]